MMVDKNRTEQALEIAETELAEIEQALAVLLTRRDAVRDYVRAQAKALGRPEPMGQKAVPGRSAPSQSEPVMGREGRMVLYRHAMDIIRAEGRPMTAPEIHAMHPARFGTDVNSIYRALYNRLGSTLDLHGGCFWPSDQPLPDGWKPPKQRRGRPPKLKSAR